MKLQKHSGIEIDPSEPFSEDRLRRQPIAEMLAELVGTLTQPYVIALDGSFGTGKSTFLTMWRPFLEQRGHICVLFNAWENDFSEDPVVPFLAELEDAIREVAPKGSAMRRALGSVRAQGSRFLRAAAPVAVQIASHGLISSDLTKSIIGAEATSEASKDVAELAKSVVTKRIAAYKQQRASMRGFRDALEKLTDSIGEESSKAEEPSHKLRPRRLPLVVMVDELDRCRPVYAIALLERIKHLFSARGVVFVLAVDRVQLGHSLRALYGAGLNVDGYLQRFIDLDYQLPEADPDKFLELLLNRFDVAGAFGVATRQNGKIRFEFMTLLLGELTKLYGLSLRSQERVVALVDLALRLGPPPQNVSEALLAILACLRIANPELFDRFGEGRAGASEVIADMSGRRKARDFFSTREAVSVQAYLVVASADPKEAGPFLAALSENSSKSGIEESEWKRRLAVGETISYLRLEMDRGHNLGTANRKNTVERLRLATAFSR